MMNAHEVITIAKKHHAEPTEARNIVSTQSGSWFLPFGATPSVLDALLLEFPEYCTTSYLRSVQAVTGWSIEQIIGFQTAMLLGGPAESAEMETGRLPYWKGVLEGTFVYEKLKKRYI